MRKKTAERGENDSMWCKNVRDLGRRGLPAVFLFAAFFTHAATLPDGPGKVETTRVCGKCHSLEQAVRCARDRRAGRRPFPRWSASARKAAIPSSRDFELPGEELRRRGREPVLAGPGNSPGRAAPE